MIVTMLVLALALSNPVAATQTTGHVDVNRAFNYVVVIVMENHGLRDVINVSSAPFMNQLASSYGLAVNYTAIDHPSLPNYLGLISGQDFSSWSSSDCSPRAGCSAGSAPNLVDSLENRGLTWKAYMEDYPSTCGSHCSPGDCFVGDNGAGVYAARHDPFVYFDDIANSTARCSRIVPANSGTSGSPDDLFLSDLSSPSTASNFLWLTPNSCNDTHGFTYHNGTVLCTDSISIGDNYLSRLVPKILASELFTHQKAALFIHYSLLSTLERVWHLQPLTSNDANASPMTEFFVAHHHGDKGHLELGDERNDPWNGENAFGDRDKWSEDDS